LIRIYETFNQAEGKSPKTISWYTFTLLTFEEFLMNGGKSTSLGDVGVEQAREFILHLQQKQRWDGNNGSHGKDDHLSPFTVQGFVRSLKAFYSWLHQEGYTEENELARLKLPKVPHKLVQTLTEEEIRRIMSCFNPMTTIGARNMAIVMMLLDTGIRCSELTSLKLSDVHMQEGHIKVFGKGGKERIVPIGSGVQKAIQRYVLHFRPEQIDLDVEEVFLNLDDSPLTYNAIKMLLSRLAKKSGIKRLHVHLYRHTFATNYLMNGGDVFSLQQILGHSTLEMVRNYVSMASTQVKVQHRKYSPVDTMGLGRMSLGRATRNRRLNGNGLAERHSAFKNGGQLPAGALTPHESGGRRRNHGGTLASKR
jgi:site-specific recombinase XerD